MRNHPQLFMVDRGAHQQQLAGPRVLLSIAEVLPPALDGLGVCLRGRLTLATQIAQGVTDDASFQTAKRGIAALLGDEVTSHLGQMYDPERMKQVIAWGTERGEFLKQQHSIDNANKAWDLSVRQPRTSVSVRSTSRRHVSITGFPARRCFRPREVSRNGTASSGSCIARRFRDHLT